MQSKPSVFFFHLLNDFSGSPKVLSQVIRGYLAHGFEVHLHTSIQSEGFLSNIKGVYYHDNQYQYGGTKWKTLWTLLLCQMRIMLFMTRRISAGDLVYINTLLPFGAAICGKLKRVKVIYHIHEVSIKPRILNKCLLYVVKKCGTHAIFVSQYVADQIELSIPSTIIWNAIGDDFLAKAVKHRKRKSRIQHILMLSSLKEYKGVDDFIRLAGVMEILTFHLVLNSDPDSIANYFQEVNLPSNVHLYPSQKDVHPFYGMADLVLNLSRPEGWVETFGLTALEAMSYGIPVIVPEVGGIAEIVTNGETGFHMNGRNIAGIQNIVHRLNTHTENYQYISHNAMRHSQNFSEKGFLEAHINLVQDSNCIPNSGTHVDYVYA